MFKYLMSILHDFKAAYRRNVQCQDQVLEAAIVNTASSLVTAEAVLFALHSALADGQYLHQHLGRLQVHSRTCSLEIIDRYALGLGVDDVSAIIIAPRVSIADTPWLARGHANWSVLPQRCRWYWFEANIPMDHQSQ